AKVPCPPWPRSRAGLGVPRLGSVHSTTPLTVPPRGGARTGPRSVRWERARAAARQASQMGDHLSGGVSAQELGDGAQAALGLLVETVPCEIPLNTNQQQLVAHIVPVASRPRRVIAPAQFGDVLESATGRERFWHSALKRPMNDGEICPPAQFGCLSRGRHTHTRRHAPALGNHFPAVVPTNSPILPSKPAKIADFWAPMHEVPRPRHLLYFPARIVTRDRNA